VLALLYDVHGNLPALEAVLADASDADEFLLGGDYATAGAWPREVVERLTELPNATWIRGNADRWLADQHDLPDKDFLRRAVADCVERLGEETVAELASLPEERVMGPVRYCHASPASDIESFFPDPVDGEERLLEGVDEWRVVFGHTHLPFRRTGPRGIELVNPGSVGLPFDGEPRPAYALVRDDGELELRRVDYDHEAAARETRTRLGDWAETFARRIEQARFDV
jgi:diadenosine tetraphosphatase ApaH/serine/threonine PP2A family protein phosphatase